MRSPTWHAVFASCLNAINCNVVPHCCSHSFEWAKEEEPLQRGWQENTRLSVICNLFYLFYLFAFYSIFSPILRNVVSLSQTVWPFQYMRCIFCVIEQLILHLKRKEDTYFGWILTFCPTRCILNAFQWHESSSGRSFSLSLTKVERWRQVAWPV